MNVVKEYEIEKTKIRIHKDYLSQDDKVTKEKLIRLVIKFLKT